MITFAKKYWRSEERADNKLYFLILASLALVQLVRILGSSGRMLVFTSEQATGGFPLSQWWTSIDIRSCFWLLFAPLLALVIVKHEAPFSRKLAAHLALLAAGIALSGTIVNRAAYLQTAERARIMQPPSSDDTSVVANSPKQSDRPTARRFHRLLAYEDAPGFPGFGLRYWLGQLFLGLTDYAMMAILGYAVLYYRLSEYRSRQTERLRSMMIQHRHDVLCNRLTHHFLFNTLNMISALTLTNGRAARTCISQLGELLRASIDSLPKGEVRLDEELRNLELYLSLQQSRFGDKLEYSIDVEPGLDRALVPAFLLQPLVENSFEHGFRKCVGVASVRIVARREGEFCRLEVIDNGAEMDGDLTIDEQYGLGITRERLNLQYNRSASIWYEPNQPSGLRVSILVPYRLEAEPVACLN